MHQMGVTSGTIWARGLKRVCDILGSVILVIALSPVLLITILLVKLTSRGPLLFIQERSGVRGEPFRLVKFRTMRGGRIPDPKEIVPLDHPEIMWVGRIMRRLKIDELAQLINVLGGTMSLIGPRPTLPDQVAAYDDFRRQRLLVRPGITGLAQVYGNSMVAWDERILFDIAYVRRCGFMLDVSILLRTVLVIVAGERRMTRAFGETKFRSVVSPPTGYGDD